MFSTIYRRMGALYNSSSPFYIHNGVLRLSVAPKPNYEPNLKKDADCVAQATDDSLEALHPRDWTVSHSLYTDHRLPHGQSYYDWIERKQEAGSTTIIWPPLTHRSGVFSRILIHHLCSPFPLSQPNSG